MALRVGLLRSCVFASLVGLAQVAHAQSADPLGDAAQTTADGSDPGSAEVAAPAAPIVPRLTITAEEALAPLPPPRRAKAKPVTPEADGLSTGGLRLFPALEMGSVYSSNVKQSATDKKSAVGLRVAPSLRVESDWTRHALRASLDGDYTAYAGSKADNTASLRAAGDFRLDIRRTTTADFSADYALTPVRPDDTGLPGGASNRRLDHTFNTDAALNQDFGPLTVRVRTGVERKLYGSEDLVGGGTRDNKDLNLWRPNAGLRVTYSEPPAVKPYAEVNYGRRYHDEKLDSAGRNTNSGDFDARLGVTLDDGALWSGDLALTYLRRDYSDGSLSSDQAFGLNGDINWRPTQLTTVVIGASTSLDDATVKGRSYVFRGSVTQSLRDNLDLRTGASVTFDKSPAGVDKTYDAGIGLDWQIVPEWSLTAGYDFTKFNSALPDQDYSEHRVSVGITLRR